MIPLTRLDGTPTIVNSDQITWIDYNPDTVITLANGEKLIVREPPGVVVERVRDFKRALAAAPRPEGPALTVVEDVPPETW